MKKQIILMAALVLTLTACGQEAEKTVEAGKSLTDKAVDASKAATEKVVDAGKSAAEKVVDAGKSAAEKAVDTGKAAVEKTADAGKAVMEKAGDAVASAGGGAGADGKAVFSACAGCHGADGKTKALSVSPIIAGQSKDDLVMKIKGYKDGSYGGAMKSTMAPMVANLTDDQIAAVAEYISGL